MPHALLIRGSTPRYTVGDAGLLEISVSYDLLQLTYRNVFRITGNLIERQCINGRTNAIS